MENGKSSLVYSYYKQSSNYTIHVLYYAVTLVMRHLYQSKSGDVVGFIVFLCGFFILLYSSTINSPRLLPARKLGKLVYNGRLVFKCFSYFVIVNLENTVSLLLYLILVFLVEGIFIYLFIKHKDALFEDFDDLEIEERILSKQKR